MYKSSYDSEYKIEVATLFVYTEQVSDELVHVTIKIAPEEDYKLDSLNLEIGIILPVSAVILGDPQSGQPADFDYVRTDDIASVKLDFPGMDFKTGEAISVDFWLDLPEMEPNIKDSLTMDTSFSIHALSVFKIVRLEADSTVKLIVP